MIINYNSTYLEIREGIGGLESNLFVYDMFRFYERYVNRNSFVLKILSLKKLSTGYKRIIIRVLGNSVYNLLQNEVGVHRVQRVPSTDKRNRIHTSTCIVEVYPEVILPKFSVLKKDLQIDTFKSSGPGGQHTNKTNSAVRIIHIPTGIKVECQNERSQSENKKLAINILVSKLNQYNLFTANRKVCLDRKVRVYSFSTRSTKIRTYNYVRNIIIDHINHKKFMNLNRIFSIGALDLMF